MALLVTGSESLGDHEARIAALLCEREIPFAVVQNKADAGSVALGRADGPEILEVGVPVIRASAHDGLGIAEVRAALERLAPERALPLPPCSAICYRTRVYWPWVVPIDTGAPKGRLVLPQVQAIRDSLGGRKLCMVVTEEELVRSAGPSQARTESGDL